jgi:RNA polymerase sigma factor (TIGR02999 family)
MLPSRVATDFDRLIQRAESDQGSADELFALLYQELHRLAEHNLRRSNATITLDATTLLHEAYLNISGRKDVAFADQPSFLAYASRAMRGLVIDYARHRRALKRGRQLEITLADDEQPSADRMQRSEELERLGDAIEELSVLDPALAELVDLHFFCGFTFAEIAEFRGSSERTVQRDWRKARLLLQHSLMDDEDNEV